MPLEVAQQAVAPFLRAVPGEQEVSIGHALIADAMTHSGRAPQWQGSGDAVAAALAADVREGDVVITIGAGDITKAGPALLALLRRA